MKMKKKTKIALKALKTKFQRGIANAKVLKRLEEI